ncbi:hypothetical protein JCM10512_1480 [Bacteroides reticulotermitis JCM 10512]|uniref:Uncharacterized protein n=1 Tax=Bacteroides reticulotermitis JCM 10512 TaxID=1445607 RepID=W4UQX7_9BACE|nr:hypothetical protein JCM10512_1480 [Bacteroides reticulotermitis JCM 10512]
MEVVLCHRTICAQRINALLFGFSLMSRARSAGNEQTNSGYNRFENHQSIFRIRVQRYSFFVLAPTKHFSDRFGCLLSYQVTICLGRKEGKNRSQESFVILLVG